MIPRIMQTNELRPRDQNVRPDIRFMNPSDTSSCHPSLFARVIAMLPSPERETPCPPSTTSRPSSSVPISPS